MKCFTDRQGRCRAQFVLFAFLVASVVIGGAGVCRADVLDSIKDAFRRWELFQGLEVSGQNRLTFQRNLVDGSATAYENQRWDTGSMVRQTSLHLQGPIWKEFAFQADLSSSGYGPSYSRWIVGYSGHDTSLFYGDVNINLGGNEFVSFSKPLKGYQLDQVLPNNGLLRAFSSQEKGYIRNQTFSGNNTSGPYFLTYTPVIDGSEVVKVNEEVQKFGVDYRLDYQSGQLYFEPVDQPPKIIPDTAIISVSYQSYGYGTSPSKLEGFRAEMPLLGDRMLIGVTHVRQSTDTPDADTVGYQEDVYQGSGSTGPFDTIFRPIIANGTAVIYKGEHRVIDQALVVLVDNAEQAEGVDYDSYRDIGRIIFRRAVPPTALVLIRYYYDLSTNYDTGNNEVTGIDLNYRITNNLSLQADYGLSDRGEGKTKGDAMQVNLNYSKPRLSALASYRDISPDFSYINSVGFYRQEKGSDVGVRWQPHDHIRLYTRYSDLASSQGYSFGYSSYGGGIGFDSGYDQYGGGSGGYGGYGGYGYSSQVSPAQFGEDATTLDISTERREYEVDFDFPGWPTASLSRQEMSNTGGSSGDSDMTTDQLRLQYAPSGGKYSISASMYATNQFHAGTAEDEEKRGSSTNRHDVSARWQPSSKLSISANLGHNESTSAFDDNRSSSDTTQFTVQWAPKDNLRINLDHRLAESVGRVSYYGGYSSYSPGFGGIGGGGGGYVPPGQDDDDDDDGIDKYEDTNSQLRISWQPSNKLSLDGMIGQRKYTSGGSVGYLADSDQTTRNLSVNYRASDEWGINAMWGTDMMEFLQEGRGAVSNDMLSLGVSYQPEGKPYNAGLSVNMQTGSSPTYVGFGPAQKMFMVDNDLFDVRSYFSYRISEKSSVSLNVGMSDFSGGYADFKKTNLELQYQHRLSDLVALSFGYRYIRNVSRLPQDPRLGYTSLTPSSQNYVANTFMLTLSTDFHSGMGGSSAPRYTGFGGTGGYGLGSFGGYRSNRYGGSNTYGGFGGQSNYGSYNTYSGQSMGSYGTGYGQFEDMRRQGTYQDQSRLPGYGIFEGAGTSRQSSAYQGQRTGLDAGLGDFKADKRHQTGDLRDTGPAARDAIMQPPPAPGIGGEDRGELPSWWMPEDLWEYWPYGVWDGEL